MTTNKIRGFEVVSSFQDQKINLPVRKTKNSVGYDFESAEDIVIPSMWKNMIINIGKFFQGRPVFNEIKPTIVKTGVKAYFQENEALILANRSSNPVKKGLVLSNSIGIIEADYYNNLDNEGHMMFGFYNFFPFDVEIKKGDSIGQGFFINYLKVDNDISEGIRVGGWGSTDTTQG